MTKKINKKDKYKRYKDHKVQLFKLVLTGILLGLAVATSLIEIPLSIMGVMLPLRIFDALIIAFALPIIGFWRSIGIGIIEPWIHLALDGDHPPIQMFFDNVSNVFMVCTFYFFFYFLFKCNKCHEKHEFIQKGGFMKKFWAGLIIIPTNAVVSTAGFILTLVILYFNPFMSNASEYAHTIKELGSSFVILIFILLAIEVGRYLFIYVLFTIIQKKLHAVTKYYENNLDKKTK